MTVVRRLVFLLCLLIVSACGGAAVEEAATAQDSDQEAAAEPADGQADEEVVETAEDGDESEDAGQANGDDTDDEAGQDADDAEASSAGESSEEVTDDTAAESSGASVEVVLLDAGAEPRQELRYTITDGTETLTTLQVQSQSQSIDGTPTPEGPPVGIITDQEITVSSVDGGVLIESVVTDARVSDDTDPGIASLLTNSLEPLLGLTTTSTIDERGVASDGTVGETGDPGIDQLLGEFGDLSNPLPEEAVGVGAVWQVEIPLEATGLSVTNRVTSTLREFTENGVILDTEIEQISNDIGQQVDLGGVQAIVDDWTSTGQGFIEIAFDQVSPVSSEASIESFQAFTMAGQGSIEQSISITTTITGG